MQENFTLRQRAALERPTFPANPVLFRAPEKCEAAILDCRVTDGFESLPAREGPSSATFENSWNLAPFSCELGQATTGNTMEDGRGGIRELQSSAISNPRCKQGAATLKPCSHTGGTYSHCGVTDYTRFPISELHLENFLTPWNFKAGKSTSSPRYVQNQRIFRTLCTGSKKL